MDYRQSALFEQRPRILRLTIDQVLKEFQEEAEQHPPPDPDFWPMRVDPRLPEPQLRRALWIEIGALSFISVPIHSMITFALVLALAVTPFALSRALVFLAIILGSFGITTVLPTAIWMRRRLRRASEMRQRWEAQGGWPLSQMPPFGHSGLYFAEACRELFNDLRARVGLPHSAETELSSEYLASREHLALRKHFSQEQRFLTTHKALGQITEEMVEILSSLGKRMRLAHLLPTKDRTALDVRDQRRLDELYSEFCETVRVRIEVDETGLEALHAHSLAIAEPDKDKAKA